MVYVTILACCYQNSCGQKEIHHGLAPETTDSDAKPWSIPTYHIDMAKNLYVDVHQVTSSKYLVTVSN